MIAAAMAGYHRVIYISKYVGTMLPAVSDRRLVVRPISAVPASIPKQNTSSLVVGIAGRLDVEKRIELAIEAVGMSEPHVILHVYGDSFSDQDDYRATLVQLGEKLLPNRVRFMGTVPASHIYEEIDLLFVANSQEASGRTVGEAMAAGVPVVVPSRGGAQEFLEHMSSGLVYDADSALSASNAISLLAASQELRSQVRDGGKAKIQLERSTLRIAQLYLDALAD
jgi:glycosyltransferase involved in cell wall biosynthesis